MSRAPAPRTPYQGGGTRSWILWCLKYGLLLGAFLLAIAFVVWPYVHEMYLAPPPIVLPEKLVAEKKTILRPRYTSESQESGRMIQVEAEEARQISDEEIRLEKPAAEVQLSDGHTLVVHSKTGHITPDHQHATLEQGVRMEHDGGYVLETSVANIHLTDHQATGNKPVKACGPMGCVEAQGFSLDQKDAHLSFKGKTRINIQTE